MTIYIITNQVNGKKYVGQTTLKYPCQRWAQHKCWATKSQRNDMPIIRAIRKYGPEAFTIEYYKLHDGASQNLLNQMECLAIVKYNSMVPDGYNVREGGSRGKHTIESRQRMSASRKGRIPWNKGIPWSEEMKVVLSKTKGIPHGPQHNPHGPHGPLRNPRGPMSKEQKLKIKTTMKNRPTFSEAHCLAISEGLRKRYEKEK